jgi:hypothetical protein
MLPTSPGRNNSGAPTLILQYANRSRLFDDATTSISVAYRRFFHYNADILKHSEALLA